MTGTVSFQGEAPFALPAAQSAVANARDGLVVVTLSVVAPGHGPAPVPVEVAMLPAAADLLAKMLVSSIADAKK